MTYQQHTRDKVATRLEETHQDLFRQRICWADALEMADAALQALPVDVEGRVDDARQIENLTVRLEGRARAYENAFSGRKQAWEQLERIALMCNAPDDNGTPDVEITQVDKLVESYRDELFREKGALRRQSEDTATNLRTQLADIKSKHRAVCQENRQLRDEIRNVQDELEALRKGKGVLRVGNLTITASGNPEPWQPRSGERVTAVGSDDTEDEGREITGDYIGVCAFDRDECAMIRAPYEPTPIHVSKRTLRSAMKGENA